MQRADPKPAAPWLPLLAAALLALVVDAAIARTLAPPDGDWLRDSDSYMRLLRVERLWQGAGWFDSLIPRSNWPNGEVLHWTRPLDLLVSGLALPFLPFMELKPALAAGGTLLGPLLHAAIALTMAWAALPLLGAGGAFAAGTVAALGSALIGYAIPGHVDHHLLLALFGALALGQAVRGRGAAAGLFLAAALWVSPEALPWAAVILFLLALPWLGGGSVLPALKAALALAGALAAALALERGEALLTVEHDRLSVVHVAAVALVADFFVLMLIRSPSGRLGRWVAALVGGCLTLLVLRLVFPQVLAGPLAEVEPAVRLLFDRQAENQSLLDRFSVRSLVLHFGVALLALPMALGRARRSAQWAALAVALPLFLALALHQLRWAVWMDLAAAIPAAAAILWLRERLLKHLPAASAGAFAFFAVALVPAVLGAALPGGEEPARAPARCPLPRLASHIAGWPAAAILAPGNYGPELMYRTPHRVLGTPYHRNGEGIMAARAMFGAARDDEAKRLMKARGVGLVLLCAGGNDDLYDVTGLRTRLLAGEVPPWLEPLPLPAGMEDFRLFRVR